MLGSLSPSRAADFKTCPLLYRFRTIDRLPETPDRAATRGTVVHAVLQRLFDLPAAAAHRRPRRRPWSTPSWSELLADEPRLGELFADDADGHELADWLESANRLVDNYFTLEDPARLEPAEREQLVEVVIDGLRLRGYIDRLDVTADGDIRVVDYKTGSVPREAFEAKALFQMKFYALVLWRTRGVVPRQLKLIYLADRDTLSYAPEAAELERFEAHAARDLGRDRQGHPAGRVPAEPEPALRLVQSPRQLPGLRWHSPAVPVRGARAGRGRSATGISATAAGTPRRHRRVTRRPCGSARPRPAPRSARRAPRQPAASAEAMPIGESSIATQSAAATPSRAAACRYGSGAGFGCSTSSPHTVAAK